MTNLGIINIDKTKKIYYNKNIQKLTKCLNIIYLSRLMKETRGFNVKNTFPLTLTAFAKQRYGDQK